MTGAVVSVVIPCYDQARFLPAAIGSVHGQTRGPAEVIVVDDGSHDDTPKVAARCGARVIRQKNSGVSSARNAGLRVAHGEYVIFLDADDELLPGAIETGLAALSAHPHAVCAVGRTRPMDGQGREIPSAAPRAVVADVYREWLSENFVSTPGAAIFRRAPLEAIGGFTRDVGPAADYALYLQLARARQVVDHGAVVVRYRSHPQSMSRNGSVMLDATMRVLRNEARHAPAAYAADLQRGRAHWARWYGEQIIEWLRDDWHARGPNRAQLTAVRTMLRYCPSLLAERLQGRIRRAFVSSRADHGR